MNRANGKILLVEDEEADIELVIGALRKHNLSNEINVARDGEEALDYLYRRGEFEKLQGEDPILVLLDLKMPKLGGIEVLKTMESDKKLKNIPVVVLTSSRENPDIQKCYELGVNAYVVKPVDFAEFTEAIKNVGLFWLLINQPPSSQL